MIPPWRHWCSRGGRLVIGSVPGRGRHTAYRRRPEGLQSSRTVIGGGSFATTDQSASGSPGGLENLTFAPEAMATAGHDRHFAPLGLKIAEVPISVTYDVPHKHS